MRWLGVLVVLCSAASAAPRAPKARIDVAQFAPPPVPPPPTDATKRLCRAGDREECEALCAKSSAVSCWRLGWLLALGGANESDPLARAPQDFAAAAVPMAKACKLGFLPACVDLQTIEQNRRRPADQAQLRATCKAGYGRACTALASLTKNTTDQRALLADGCRGGDGDACLTLADAADTPREMLELARKAMSTPAPGRVSLTCPAGTQAFRMVTQLEVVRTEILPRWTCGVFDPKTKRIVENGPYLEFLTEADEAAYPHGVISERGTNVDGEKHGIVDKLDARGLPRSRVSFKHGLEDGVGYQLKYDSTGELSEITMTTWREGRRGTSQTTQYK